jgi:hypothetical protein
MTVLVPAVVAPFIPLLFRRRFPFAAPVAVLLALGAVSFVDGRVLDYVFVPILAAIAASFLFGLQRDARLAVAGLALSFATSAVVATNEFLGSLEDVLWPIFVFTLF